MGYEPIKLQFVKDDGGRAAAGFRGKAGDCVTRAIAIAMELPYREVYEAMAAGTESERRSKHSHRISGRRTARSGIHTHRKWFKDWMQARGWTFIPTMQVGQGCTVHLAPGEIPMTGRIIVSLSRHYAAVVDGVIHDTEDPSRDGTRCVYGYWVKEGAQ